MKIPTILKGDDAGAITLALDSSHSYDGATLVVAYQGATKTFTGLAAGGTVSLVYNHVETAAFRLGCYPMEARLIGAGGSVETVSNAEWRIKVTDIVSEVNCGGSFAVVPGAAYVPVTDVEELGGHYTLADLAAKINEHCRILAQRTAPVSGPSAGPLGAVALVLLFSLGAFAANVQTARLDDMYNDERVVTNVTFEGLAESSNVYTKGETEAKIVELAPAPGNYATVSNAAMTAVQPGSLSFTNDYIRTSWADDNTSEFAGHANEANYADRAGTAEWADYASSAGDATEANHSSSADWATYADRAGISDFSNYAQKIQFGANVSDAKTGEEMLALNKNYTDNATSNLARVAHTGSYNDLSNKPTIPTVPTAQINAATTTNALQDAELESHASQLSQLSQSLDGKVPTSRTINGKALTSNISLSADDVGATTPADVTAAIREQSLGGIWDAELEVWWTPRMKNGSLTYEATTNVNLNAAN